MKESRFTYDVFGRLIGRWVDSDGAGPGAGVQTWHVYDGLNPYADFNGAGSLTNRYLYGPAVDEIMARFGGSPLDEDWYLTDLLGSVRQIADTNGTILDQIIYESFGKTVSETNPAEGDRFKFTAREWDADADLYDYRRRPYLPGPGRFAAEDPIEFAAGAPNLYRYVGNQPTGMRDPLGLLPDDVPAVMDGGGSVPATEPQAVPITGPAGTPPPGMSAAQAQDMQWTQQQMAWSDPNQNLQGLTPDQTQILVEMCGNAPVCLQALLELFEILENIEPVPGNSGPCYAYVEGCLGSSELDAWDDQYGAMFKWAPIESQVPLPYSLPPLLGGYGWWDHTAIKIHQKDSGKAFYADAGEEGLGGSDHLIPENELPDWMLGNYLPLNWGLYPL